MSDTGAVRSFRIRPQEWYNAHFLVHPDANSSDPAAKQRSNYTDSNNPTSYKVKKYCRYCWQTDMKEHKDHDLLLVQQGVIQEVRPDSHWAAQLWDNSNRLRMTRGEKLTMINHLASCTSPCIPPEVKSEAMEQKAKSPRQNTRRATADSHVAMPPPVLFQPPQASSSSERLPTSSPSPSPSLFLSPHGYPHPPSSPSVGPDDSASQVSSNASRHSTPVSNHSRLSRQPSIPRLIGDHTLLQPWLPERIQRYEFLMGAITSTAGLPMRWIENKYLRTFLDEFVPMAPKISRLTLRRRILPQILKGLRTKVGDTVRNQNGTLEEDGWTGLNHRHLMSFMVGATGSVFTVKTEDVSLERRTGEFLFERLKVVYEMVQTEYGVRVIAVVTDASGDSRKARRLFARHFPAVIVLDCYAHQINLIVGDFFKSKSDLLVYADMAVTLIGWLRRKTGILVELHHAILRAILTRWTAHYQAYARLLLVRLQLRAIIATDRVEPKIVFIGDKDQIEMAEEMSIIIEDDNFWKALVCITQILEPLAIAAHVVQGSFVRLDTVLLTFGWLHMRYEAMLHLPTITPGDDLGIKAIIKSIAKRWSKSDKEAFLACILINPRWGLDLFCKDQVFFMLASLPTFLSRMYCRLFSVPVAPVAFDDEVDDFLNRSGRYSTLADSVELEIRRSSAKGAEFDPIRVLNSYKIVGAERSPFLEFVVRLLEVTCNSASCERLFSVFGNILTKHRTRMNVDTLELLAEIKMYLRDEIARSGEERKRLRKKHFDFARHAREAAQKASDTSGTHASGVSTSGRASDGDSDGDDSSNTLRAWAERQFARLEDDDTDSEPVQRSAAGVPNKLEDIFDFSTSFWLDMFERHVKDVYNDEILVYEWLQLDGDGEEDDSEEEIDPDTEHFAL